MFEHGLPAGKQLKDFEQELRDHSQRVLRNNATAAQLLAYTMDRVGQGSQAQVDLSSIVINLTHDFTLADEGKCINCLTVSDAIWDKFGDRKNNPTFRAAVMASLGELPHHDHPDNERIAANLSLSAKTPATPLTSDPTAETPEQQYQQLLDDLAEAEAKHTYMVKQQQSHALKASADFDEFEAAMQRVQEEHHSAADIYNKLQEDAVEAFGAEPDESATPQAREQWRTARDAWLATSRGEKWTTAVAKAAQALAEKTTQLTSSTAELNKARAQLESVAQDDDRQVKYWRGKMTAAKTAISAHTARLAQQATAAVTTVTTGQRYTKLSEVHYVRPEGQGTEQCIMLPILKLLRLYKHLVGVPTDSQYHQIFTAKQGESLYPGEGIPADESFTRYVFRLKDYAQSAAIAGFNIPVAQLALHGMTDKSLAGIIEQRLHGNILTLTPLALLDAVREVKNELESKAYIARTDAISQTAARHCYSGYPMPANPRLGGGPQDRCQLHPNSRIPHTNSECRQQRAAMAGAANTSTPVWTGGFGAFISELKQLRRQIQTGTNLQHQGGDNSKVQASPSSFKSKSIAKCTKCNTHHYGDCPPTCNHCNRRHYGQCRSRWPVCGTCQRSHPGDCWPVCNRCGRRHLPTKPCRTDPKTAPGPVGRPSPGVRNTAAVAAACDAGNPSCYDDGVIAADAIPTFSAWNTAGAANVAVWSESDRPAENAATLAKPLHTIYPRSFHQQKEPDDTAMVSTRAATQKQQLANIPPDTPIDRPKTSNSKQAVQKFDAAGNILLLLHISRDEELLKQVMQSGGCTGLVPVLIPRLNMQQLTQAGLMSLQPIAASAGLVAATAADPPKVTTCLSSDACGCPGCTAGRPFPHQQDCRCWICTPPDIPTEQRLEMQKYLKRVPTLPFLSPTAAHFYDTNQRRSFTVGLLMIDSGATGGLIGMHIVEREKLTWEATPGLTIRGAGSERPQVLGRTSGLKLLLKPGTPHAVAVDFNALIMPGVEGTYDALLGREQQHAVGMVLDAYTMSCAIRPRLREGLDFTVQLPISCSREAAEPFPTQYNNQPVACSATPSELGAVPMQYSYIWSHPQPLDRLTSAQVEALLQDLIRSGCIKVVKHVRYCDDDVFLSSSYLGHADLRSLNTHIRSQLVEDGTVETDPGPMVDVHGITDVVCRPWVWKALQQWVLMLLPLLTVLSASVAAITAAVAKDFEAATIMSLMLWGAAADSCSILCDWAVRNDTQVHCLNAAPYPQSKRRRAKGGTSPLNVTPCNQFRPMLRINPTRFLSSTLLLLVYLLTCCTVCTTAVQAGSSLLQTSQATGVAPCLPTMQTQSTPILQLLAHEVSTAVRGHDLAVCCHTGGASSLHPAQLLETLQPAGEKDPFTESQQLYTDPDGGFKFAIHNQYTSEEQEALRRAVRQRKHAFAYSMQDLPGFHKTVGWKLKHADPIRVPCHSSRFSPAEKQVLDEKCQELEEAGIITEVPSTCKYAAMPVLAAKKDPGSQTWGQKRLCINYIRLNKAMEADVYNPPLPETIWEKAAKCNVHTTLDLRQGFLQLVLDEESAQTTAFWWGRRLMRYNRLSFGTKNALAIFQRVIDETLREYGCETFASGYVDDILISSETMTEHVEHVSRVLDCLHAVGLRVHPEKSVFGAEQCEFLGHWLCPGKREPLKAKVAAICELSIPTNVPMLRSMLGIISYYRPFIPNFSIIARPLYDLTKKGVQWEWTQAHQDAYDQLKMALCTPGLALHQVDESRKLILHTDWSQVGISAVLGQLDDANHEYLIAAASRSTNNHERLYTPWKGECLAAIWGMKVFRPYLHSGRQFELVTDHRPLIGMLSNPAPSNCQTVRWLMSIQDLDFVVRHRPGVTHVNADVLSRYPSPESADTVGARMDRGPITTPALPDVIMPDGSIISGQQAAADLQAEAQSADTTATAAAVTLPPTETSCMAEYPLTLSRQSSKPTYHGFQLQPRAGESWLACHAPSSEQLVCMHADQDPHSDSNELQLWPAYQQQLLSQQATLLVQQAQLSCTPAVNQPNTGGVCCTTTCGNTFFPRARRQGVTLFEPFGGLGAGLEMLLRHGIKVNRYIYCDISPEARAVIQHRLLVLSNRYPDLLDPTAWEQAFDTFPQDVYHITPEHVTQAVNGAPTAQWLIVAGWECQDMSVAGRGLGLSGGRSSTYFKLIDLLQDVQSATTAAGGPQAAYIIENTAFQHNWRHQQISLDDYATVCSTLGMAIEVDAARFGSRAHRLRNFWTNLCEARKLAAAVQQAVRPSNITVQHILGPGRTPTEVTSDDQLPYYPCNKVGRPRQALPTLMAFSGSWNYRPGHPGSIWDSNLLCYTEPTADERELALGYNLGDTAAPGVTEDQRRAVLGKCIDANTLQALFGTAEAWHNASLPMTAATTTAWEIFQQPTPMNVNSNGLAAALCIRSNPSPTACILAACAADVDNTPDTCGDVETPTLEPWNDSLLLHFLQHGEFPINTTQADKDRIAKRSKRFTWCSGKLLQRMADDSTKEVPPPSDRKDLILSVHRRLGHFGVRRTIALLYHSYWWRNMYKDVQDVISRCGQCDRVRASYNGMNKTLNPLPIQGLWYRVHVDLFGPVNPSTQGNTYVMIMIDAYTKTLEVQPIKAAEPRYTADAFSRCIIGRYGAVAVVTSDRGLEWSDEFSQLLIDCAIDHRPTSPGHASANGQAERAVQVVKRALKKMCEDAGNAADWEKHLPWLCLGYNASPNASTRMAPYTLLYGTPCVIPPAVRERMTEPINFDDPETAAKELLLRKAAMERDAAMAGNNLAIAQHRDTLRYARIRDGSYLPKVREFLPGDYVYRKPPPVDGKGTSGLAIATRPHILRVVSVRDDGSVQLIGRDGKTIVVNTQNITKCHLPDIDGTIDPSLATVDEDFCCHKCDLPSDEAFLVLCDGCGIGEHIWCMNPPLPAVPNGVWLCEQCISDGLTAEEVERRQQISWANIEKESGHQQFRRQNFPSAVQRSRDAKNAAMDGRLVRRYTTSRDGSTTSKWGRIHYRGNADSRRPYLVIYQDGTEEICGNAVISKRENWLQPPGTKLPARVIIPAQPSLSRVQSAAVAAAGTSTAPLWTTASTLHACTEGNHVSSSRDVDLLLDAVRIPVGALCLDPFAGAGVIVTAKTSYSRP